MIRPRAARTTGILLVLLTALAVPGCKARQVHSLGSVQLRAHRKVAVTNVQIDLIEDKGCILFSSGLKTGRVAIEDYSVDVIHNNFLKIGFVPIERRRIKAILHEQGRTQTGLYGEQAEIGRLAGANAIFTGNISIRTELEHHPHLATAILFPPSLLYRLVVPNAKTTLTFSGRLVSVRDGSILMSGETTRKEEGFEMDQVRELIDEWFEDMDHIDDD